MIYNNDDSSDTFCSVTSSDETDSDGSFLSLPSLSDDLDAHFCDASKLFNLVHINAQSIPAHFPDLLTSFQNKNLHAILVSESWLKPCLPSTSFCLPGFRLIRNDRLDRAVGGVAIYLRSHIPFTVIDSSQHHNSPGAEHLFIEVLFSNTKLLLGVYYNPSLTIDYFMSFENLLEKFVPFYSHTIIMGDFNTCLLKKDSRTLRLTSIVQAADLHILPLSATHTFPNCLPSLLDLILVSSVSHVEKFGQCVASAFSYHDLLFLCYKLRPPKAKRKILMRRNFHGINFESLTNDVSNIDWSGVLNASSIDEKLNTFNFLLTQLYDKHAPIRPVRIKHLPAPWLTDEVKRLQKKKNIAKAKFKLDPNETSHEKYRIARNRCNRWCRDEHRRHIYKSVIEDNDTARVWNFLKSLGVGKQQQDINSQNLDLNLLNKHFSSSVTLDNITKLNTISQISASPTPDSPLFQFSQFTNSDVKKNILAVSSNSVGSDCISRQMVIPIIDYLVPIITNIFNFSISSGTFPSCWKDAVIIPLPKKPNSTSFSDLRPISILPFLSKVLERLTYNQLNLFLCRYNLLNPFQSGFRSGHSTTTALVKITDDIRMAKDKRRLTVLTLLDFSNAFNSVDFDILLAILNSLDISPIAIDWFHSYLHGRLQRVRLNDIFSDYVSINAGVPQGGVMSPLLFSIFINTISQYIFSPYHLYADDLQIYLHTNLAQLPSTINILNQELERINGWSKEFGLSVNPSKSQAIIIGSQQLISRIDWPNLTKITFAGIIIPYSEKVKNLGIIFDKFMSWDPQICEVSRKIFASIGSLRRLRNFLPIPTKIALAQSLLHPILDYADTCYLDLREDQLNKLERLQNLCIRFIFGLRKYDRVSEFRERLKWLPIRQRRNTHVLSLLYCILFNPILPSYLKERFQFLCDSHNRSLRSSENLTLKICSHSTTFYR
ncbi:unnamed protein product [Euphydryas editha]|uniref:Reverse transcriptase domain-containing protein n=1 Tax=Euphydryas editha TaxID=104508 RepID=A0AAU9UFM6_EUPED|nr:unnamed protein product [Euphydryas editha]